MCGILGFRNIGNNNYIQKRGQDCTTIHKQGDLTFVHNLLSVTGEFTKQPFIDGDIVCLYNGEIYNHRYNKSDGENLIPLYKEYGDEFIKQLDGEWAIVLFDFKKGKAIFANDLFGTKPLWRNGIEFGSYYSGVGGYKIEPNTVEIVDIKSEKLINNYKVHEFDFNNQYKDNYDDWILAFEKAVKKRATDGCFLGLSSGYDSGAILCELRKIGVEYKAYTINKNENLYIIKQRKPHELLEPTEEYKDQMERILLRNTENFKYTVRYNGEETNMTLFDDPASLGLATICLRAKEEKRKVYLSGQGADEIMSDYNKYPAQSELKEFPKKLKEWYNFYRGCQESYINKEEYIAGTFNVETRYPFLDKEVVQEFLWLSQELKNKEYKAPLYEYLTKNNFPFEKDVKRGFMP